MGRRTAPTGLWEPMLRDREMVCDACQKSITRVTEVPREGWPKMHNLCSSCFSDLKKQAIPRPS